RILRERYRLLGRCSHASVAHPQVNELLSTSYPEAGPHVIRDVDAWSAFWAHLPTEKPMPEVDFDKATLAVVIVESEPKMPVRPFVERVEARDQTAFVHWRAVPDRRPH